MNYIIGPSQCKSHMVCRLQRWHIKAYQHIVQILDAILAIHHCKSLSFNQLASMANCDLSRQRKGPKKIPSAYQQKKRWNPKNEWFIKQFPFPKGHFQVACCCYFSGGVLMRTFLNPLQHHISTSVQLSYACDHGYIPRSDSPLGCWSYNLTEGFQSGTTLILPSIRARLCVCIARPDNPSKMIKNARNTPQMVLRFSAFNFNFSLQTLWCAMQTKDMHAICTSCVNCGFLRTTKSIKLIATVKDSTIRVFPFQAP